MSCFDVFNGDADGLCALHQLRLAPATVTTLHQLRLVALTTVMTLNCWTWWHGPR